MTREQLTNVPILLVPGIDIHLDRCIKILHTILLGVVKYFWAQTVKAQDKAKAFTTFRARLNSIQCEGLSIPKIPADDMCKYSGSLIGKHFKMLAQVMPYIVYDLVPKDVLNTWNVLGNLVVLLWHTDIKYMNEYCVSSTIFCRGVSC